MKKALQGINVGYIILNIKLCLKLANYILDGVGFEVHLRREGRITMGFISLLLIGFFLLLSVMGMILLLIGVILLLINLCRHKKGREKRHGLAVAGILCLVFGFLYLVPLALIFVMAYLA